VRVSSPNLTLLCLLGKLQLTDVSLLLKYTVSQKRHPAHVDNFTKYLAIFKIVSRLDSEQNFLQTSVTYNHHTLKTLLHFPVKP